MRLVQLSRAGERRIGVVEEPGIRLIDGFPSIHALATKVMERGSWLTTMASEHAGSDVLEYEPIYRGESEWRILPAQPR